MEVDNTCNIHPFGASDIMAPLRGLPDTIEASTARVCTTWG